MFLMSPALKSNRPIIVRFLRIIVRFHRESLSSPRLENRPIPNEESSDNLPIFSRNLPNLGGVLSCGINYLQLAGSATICYRFGKYLLL